MGVHTVIQPLARPSTLSALVFPGVPPGRQMEPALSIHHPPNSSFLTTWRPAPQQKTRRNPGPNRKKLVTPSFFLAWSYQFGCI
jgi:hypothetical protein